MLKKLNQTLALIEAKMEKVDRVHAMLVAVVSELGVTVPARKPHPLKGKKVTRRNSWSDKDCQTLIRLHREGVDPQTIGDALKRTDKAVVSQASRLKKAGRL